MGMVLTVLLSGYSIPKFKNLYFIDQFFKTLDADKFISPFSLCTLNAASFLTTSLMVIPVSLPLFLASHLLFSGVARAGKEIFLCCMNLQQILQVPSEKINNDHTEIALHTKLLPLTFSLFKAL